MISPLTLDAYHRAVLDHRPKSRERTKHSRRYFLEVQSKLPAREQSIFADEGVALLDTFASVGLHIAASAWAAALDPLYVVHYWDLGDDANALLEAELALPDIPMFNVFNERVTEEIKTIVVPLARTDRRAFLG
ncbi:MAG: hypothetical protein JOZ69_17385, partial [Myxococcales bacterium]|nr:hypothetical protein [Myxococcales bacterium]